VSLSARKTKHVEADEEGFSSQWLMHEPARTPEELSLLKARIAQNPLVYGPLVSKDFQATLIQADFESEVSSRRIFETLQDIKRRFEDQNHTIHISGQPILQGWLDFYLPRMASLFLVALCAMALVLYYAFKSKRGVFLPLISAFMATLWGLGLTAAFGYKLTPSTVLAPFLVFALGVSHSVQFIKRYYEYMGRHKKNSKAAAIRITRELFVPAFTGLLTDGIGPIYPLCGPLGHGQVPGHRYRFRHHQHILQHGNLRAQRPLFHETAPQARGHQGRAHNAYQQDTRLFCAAGHREEDALDGHRDLLCPDAGSALWYEQAGGGGQEAGHLSPLCLKPYNQAEHFFSEHFATSDPYYIFVEGKAQDALVSCEVLREMDDLQRHLEGSVGAWAGPFLW
jgi:hypothetical protein